MGTIPRRGGRDCAASLGGGDVYRASQPAPGASSRCGLCSRKRPDDRFDPDILGQPGQEGQQHTRTTSSTATPARDASYSSMITSALSLIQSRGTNCGMRDFPVDVARSLRSAQRERLGAARRRALTYFNYVTMRPARSTWDPRSRLRERICEHIHRACQGRSSGRDLIKANALGRSNHRRYFMRRRGPALPLSRHTRYLLRAARAWPALSENSGSNRSSVASSAQPHLLLRHRARAAPGIHLLRRRDAAQSRPPRRGMCPTSMPPCTSNCSIKS